LGKYLDESGGEIIIGIRWHDDWGSDKNEVKGASSIYFCTTNASAA
jgi:hypothetical protein